MKQKEREKRMKSNSKNELVKLMSICGQIAELKSEKTEEKKVDESMILAGLSLEEQEQLKTLLNKLQSHWLDNIKCIIINSDAFYR